MEGHQLHLKQWEKLGSCPTIPMSYGPFIMLHLLKAHKISLRLTFSQGWTCIFGGLLCPKHLGTSELKKIIFNIAWFLSHWEFLKSTISHLSSAKWFCCWHRPQSTYSPDCLRGFRLWNTSGNTQLQELNLITFISYVYFYDIPGWSDLGK